MSDTPRVDEHFRIYEYEKQEHLLELARQLERELNAAKWNHQLAVDMLTHVKERLAEARKYEERWDYGKEVCFPCRGPNQQWVVCDRSGALHFGDTAEAAIDSARGLESPLPPTAPPG